MTVSYHHHTNTAYTTLENEHILGALIADDIQARHTAELIIPHASQNQTILCPIVSSLTQQSDKQWTTWITRQTPSKNQLQQLGAQLSRLRVIKVNKDEDARWLVWQALAQGTSHQVIAEQHYWNNEDIASMEEAAKEGRCQALLVTVL